MNKMISLPGIILIDDNQEQLDNINRAFIKIGLPCLPILYENNPENESGISHVELNNITPRIVITDLNLTETTAVEVTNLVGPILLLIEQININGPYILIFWSKNKSLVDDVIKKVVERTSNKKTLPLCWGLLDKTELLDNQEALRSEIERILNSNSLLNSLFNWENRISTAAQETINSLYELTFPDDTEKDYADTHILKLQEVIALIANESLGAKNADKFPSLAVDQGLLPVLSDRLQNLEISHIDWKESVPKIGRKVSVNDAMKAKLNTFYHIEMTDKEFPKDHRGIFLPISNTYISDERNRAKMCSKLGVGNFSEILNTEFIDLDKVYSEGKQQLIDNIIIGFVELSAECDHAQKKSKLHRYIISALIPDTLQEYCVFAKRNTRHDGIYRLPPIFINEQNHILKLSFKYQIGTIDKFQIDEKSVNHKWFGDPFFRLREQILSDISFKCSQYSSRPGIVSFY